MWLWKVWATSLSWLKSNARALRASLEDAKPAWWPQPPLGPAEAFPRGVEGKTQDAMEAAMIMEKNPNQALLICMQALGSACTDPRISLIS